MTAGGITVVMRGLLLILAISAVIVVTAAVVARIVIPRAVAKHMAEERARQRAEDAAEVRAMLERGETAGARVPQPRKSRHLYIVPALAAVETGIAKAAHEAQQHPRATAAILAGLSAIVGLILWSTEPHSGTPRTADGPPPIEQTFGPRYQSPSLNTTNSRTPKPSRSGTVSRTPPPSSRTLPSTVVVTPTAPHTRDQTHTAPTTVRTRPNPPQTHSEPPRPTPEPTHNPTTHPTTQPPRTTPPPTRTHPPTTPPPSSTHPAQPACLIGLRLDPILHICVL